MKLAGKVALVTGGARRLGKAAALRLAAEGVNIALHYHHSRAAAEATAAVIRDLGVEARLISGDLAQVSEVERLVDEAAAAWGRLDILINSAAVFFETPLNSLQEAQWNRLIDTNLKGPFFCARRAGTIMRQQESGVIVNFTDTGIYIGWEGYAPYLISKAGVEQMTYLLAKELAPQVRVNAIAPGPLLLPDDHTPEEAAFFAQATLLGRLGSREALAEAVLYLVQADYVTGVILPVDGGQRWK
jgi:pteridine reductase